MFEDIISFSSISNNRTGNNLQMAVAQSNKKLSTIQRSDGSSGLMHFIP